MMATHNVFERGIEIYMKVVQKRGRDSETETETARERDKRERGETPCTVWHLRLMQEAVQTVFQVDKNAVMFSGKVNDPLTFKNEEK